MPSLAIAKTQDCSRKFKEEMLTYICYQHKDLNERNQILYKRKMSGQYKKGILFCGSKFRSDYCIVMLEKCSCPKNVMTLFEQAS